MEFSLNSGVGLWRATEAMIFFWLLFLCCVLSAWLIGYGMGYRGGVKETIAANASAIETNPVDVNGNSTETLPAIIKIWKFSHRSLFR
jgi:hypothetical protein